MTEKLVVIIIGDAEETHLDWDWPVILSDAVCQSSDEQCIYRIKAFLVMCISDSLLTFEL